MASAREAALKILQRVETQHSYATQLLDQIARDPAFAERDRALVQQLVRGTLSQRGRIDALLDGMLRSGVAGLTPWIRNVLRMGAYQLLYLDRIPPEAAVNESVSLARRYGHAGTAGLVNAVLRRLAAQAPALRAQPAEQPEAPEAIAEAFSHPLWLVRRWVAQLGAEATRALCEANNRPWPTSARTNTLRGDTADLRARLADEGVQWRAGAYDPDSTQIVGLPGELRLHELAAFREGRLAVQDESFTIVGRLLDPQPGELVLDLCSAPGGKATHLAALMQNRGRVVAADLHARRLRLVREAADRLGATIIETAAGDGRALRLDRPADRALVDAPCSGTGVLGRRADARWNKAEADLPGLRQLQLELLLHAAALLRPGGRLVYATCTLEPEENDGVVEAFLAERRDAQLLAPEGLAPAALLDGRGLLRCWPHLHGTGGAFAAVFRVGGEGG